MAAISENVGLRPAGRRDADIERHYARIVGTELTMERVTLARALSWKRRRVYHRMSSSGELVRVEAIERKGRHFRLTLANGQSFLVDRDHILYTPPKEEQLQLG